MLTLVTYFRETKQKSIRQQIIESRQSGSIVTSNLFYLVDGIASAGDADLDDARTCSISISYQCARTGVLSVFDLTLRNNIPLQKYTIIIRLDTNINNRVT